MGSRISQLRTDLYNSLFPPIQKDQVFPDSMYFVEVIFNNWFIPTLQWKRIVKRQKFVSATKKLSENSCIFGNSKMRHCFLQVQSLVGKLTDMGVTEILARKTYDLDDFFSRQLTLVSNFATNFGDFRHIVCQLVFDTCKATFSDAGFSSDEYPLELAEIERLAQREYEGRTLYSSSGSSGSSSRSSSRSYQKPRKLTFIEQVNKRKACENLVRFIKLIDFMMRYTAHMIVCNSLIAVHKSLTSRAKSRPTPGELTSTDKEASGSVESDTEIPVFSCKVLLNAQIITISPNLDKFDEGFRNLLTKLDEAVQSVPVLFQDVIFNPYTQPILYGKMENYKAQCLKISQQVSFYTIIMKDSIVWIFALTKKYLYFVAWKIKRDIFWWDFQPL